MTYVEHAKSCQVCSDSEKLQICSVGMTLVNDALDKYTVRSIKVEKTRKGKK